MIPQCVPFVITTDTSGRIRHDLMGSRGDRSYSRGAIFSGLTTMPKKRLISGMSGFVAQGGEQIFRPLAGRFQVQRIRTEIHVVAPQQFAG